MFLKYYNKIKSLSSFDKENILNVNIYSNKCYSEKTKK